MGYRLEKRESLQHSVRRIACEQIDKALATYHAGDTDAAVHELRKRCKKIRGLVRLVRPGFDDYAQANERFRDIARIVSQARDRAAALETHRALIDRYGAGADLAALETVGAELEQRKAEFDRRAEVPARLERAVAELRAARGEAADWSIDEGDGSVARGLEKTYGRAREAMKKAMDEPSAEQLHEWRKRVKYHRYHAKLLRKAWPAIFSALYEEAKRLSDHLGDDHDLAVLRAELVDDPEQHGGDEVVRTYVALLDGRRQRLQDDAFDLGKRLCASKPRGVRKRVRAVLELWR